MSTCIVIDPLEAQKELSSGETALSKGTIEIWLASATSTTADARDERRPRKRRNKQKLNLFFLPSSFFFHKTSSYVAAAYVKWIEAAGGRAVPIRFYVSDGELRRLFDSINGLILPGEELKVFFFKLFFLFFFFPLLLLLLLLLLTKPRLPSLPLFPSLSLSFSFSLLQAGSLVSD